MAEHRLIYANEAIQKIQVERNKYLQTSELTYTGLTIAKKIIEEASTVDAVPVKQGKPIPHYLTLLNSDDDPVETYRCGYECPFCGDTGIKNFCSNCGARMESCR